MPRRISLKRHVSNDDWYWQTLCIVYDNEALGFMERLLQSAGFEFKVTEV